MPCKIQRVQPFFLNSASNAFDTIKDIFNIERQPFKVIEKWDSAKVRDDPQILVTWTPQDGYVVNEKALQLWNPRLSIVALLEDAAH